MTRTLPAASLLDFLRALRQNVSSLVAPVESHGLRQFRPVENVEQIALGEGNTRWSFKEVLFPRTEPLFHYRLKDSGVELAEAELPEGETVIYGARPCDAAGLAVLDAVFSWNRENIYYRRRRERATIIGLSCARPGPACFCTAVGLSPTGTRGSDLLLTPIGGDYLAEASTDKGRRILETHARFFTDASASKDEVTRAAEEGIRRRPPLGAGDQPALKDLFEDPRWQAAARACLGCGACTFICPTCHCFDIVDEGDAYGGSRCKNWDSCGFALFTLHTSGHNPRSTQAARFRQRVLHKFRYIPERFQITGCVGCGRCILTCPVNMDIYEVATELAGQSAA